ncbi:hypothetical protein RhiirB3_390872 [Rhizophagus irregularis]|nr:hypothetical protein RhiirB3_390872 [Rhizophagus irregularis]
MMCTGRLETIGDKLSKKFSVKIDKDKSIFELKRVIKAKNQNCFAGIDADRLKLWKVGIPIKQQSPELTAVSNFSVNIKEELGGVELSPFDDISEHFDDDSKKPVKKNLHIIVQPLIEDSKEVHCTASYGNRNNKITFQWTVTREMVTLAGLKKRLCEYFTFPDWTESEHLVISRVVGKRFGTKSKSSSSKTIHISTDEDLASIIWTPAPKMDLKIVVDTPSSFDGDVKIFSEYEVSGRYGKGLIDWIIRIGDIIIHVTEAKGNVISHGIGQSTVQAHASMQRNKLNRKKRSYDDADLYDEEMFCIISTGTKAGFCGTIRRAGLRNVFYKMFH